MVGACRERGHVGGKGNAGTARGTAASERWVEGVACCPKERIDGVGANAAFGNVRLTDWYAARSLDAGHDASVFTRLVVGEVGTAIGRWHVGSRV